MILASRAGLVVAAGLAVLCVGPSPHAQTMRTEFRVVFAAGRHLGRELDQAARDGYSCLSVARPEPDLTLPGVVVVLGRAAGVTTAGAAHRAIQAGGRGTDLQASLDRAGADGFRLCGVALVEQSSGASLMAVMIRRPDAGSTPWRYTVEATDDRKSLVHLTASAGEGFVPVAAAQIGDNRVPEMRSWIVVTERGAMAGSASDVSIRTSPGPEGFQKAILEQSSQGYRISLLWKESSRMVALMSRSSAVDAAHPTYAVETMAASAIHGLSGVYLGDFPYLGDGQRVVVRERSMTASNLVVEDRLPSLGALDYVGVSELRELGDHLARNTGGYTLSAVSIRRDARGAFVLRSVFTRLGL